VKWIAVPKAGSTLPRASNLYFCGPYVYALLADLDANFAVTGLGRVIAIDPRTDTLVGTPLSLTGSNPGANFEGIAPVDPTSGSCDQVLVADTGDFNKKTFPAGGGIEQVDLTRMKSLGFLLTDMDFNGRPGTISVAGSSLAFTVVNNADFTQRVTALDPSMKKVLGDVVASAGFVSFAQVSPDKQLFVGVVRGTKTLSAGVFILPAANMPLSGMPIDLMQAPYAIAFY
jgi:hypothetical protein